MPQNATAADTDTWIDQELASLRRSIELTAEPVAAEPGTARLPSERARSAPVSARRARLPVRALVRRSRRALHAQGFDLGVGVAAAIASIAVGLLIPLVLK